MGQAREPQDKGTSCWKFDIRLDLHSQVVAALLESLRCANLCFQMLPNAMLRHAMLCYAMSSNIFHPCLAHAKAELRIVFEEGVGPRRALTLGVHRVWEGWIGAAPDGRAASEHGDQQQSKTFLCERNPALSGALARRVGDDEPVPEPVPALSTTICTQVGLIARSP